MQSPSGRKNTRSTSKRAVEESPLGPKWNREEVFLFFNGLKIHGTNWRKIVGEGTELAHRQPHMAENLFKSHKNYLTGENSTAEGFAGVMEDFYSRMAIIYPEVKRQLFTSPKRQKTNNKEETSNVTPATGTGTWMPPKMRDKNIRKETFQEEKTQIIEQNPTEEGKNASLRLESALNNPKLRKWCIYEWFYPTIDRPFFNQNEFQEALNENNLGKIPKMSRIEWCYFRDLLGKPRRFSEAFLKEEKKQLYQYRDSVRRQRQGSSSKGSFQREAPPHLNEGNNVVVLYQGELYRATVVSIIDSSSYSVFIQELDTTTSLSDTCIMSSELDSKLSAISPDFYPSPIRQEDHFHTPIKSTSDPPELSSSHGARVIRPEQVVEYLKLIKTKSELLKEIVNLNKNAEDLALAGEEFSKEFKKDYAYCISLLNSTNKDLESISSRFSKASTPDTMTRSLTELPSDKFQPWLRQISPKCKNTARKLVSDRLSRIKLKFNDENENSNQQQDSLLLESKGQDQNISKSVSSCVSLLLHLAECAEAELPTVDMNFAVESALASCRPRFDANTSAFLELEKEVREIQSEFLSRPPRIK